MSPPEDVAPRSVRGARQSDPDADLYTDLRPDADLHANVCAHSDIHPHVHTDLYADRYAHADALAHPGPEHKRKEVDAVRIGRAPRRCAAVRSRPPPTSSPAQSPPVVAAVFPPLGFESSEKKAREAGLSHFRLLFRHVTQVA